MKRANAEDRVGRDDSVQDSSAEPQPWADTDPRRRRTREAIVRAGAELFGLHHPEGVSIDELIRAARVSKQSFYNHFADKDALAHEILRIARAELDEQVDDANRDQGDPARRLAAALCVYARQAMRNPLQGRLIARLPLEDVAADSDTNLRAVADLRAGLAQGRLAILTLDTGLTFVLGAGQALVSRVLLDREPGLVLSVSQQFVTLVLRAFGLPPIEAELIASEAADRILRQAD